MMAFKYSWVRVELETQSFENLTRHPHQYVLVRLSLLFRRLASASGLFQLSQLTFASRLPFF
jgi:hypothetical protein